MTNEESKNICMKRNVKLHPMLNALTWDVIFVWTISTMFFYEVKHLTYSQIIALDSILMIFGCLMCVPVQRLLQNIKSNIAIRFGCFGYAGYLILCMFGTNYATFVFAQLFLAFGYVVMSVKINGVLTKSLSVLNREREYNKITGKGFSLYYIIECVGAILITYVYNFNPYLAYGCSLVMVATAFIISFFITETSKFQERNVEINSKQETKSVKKPDSYLKIAFSGFFLSLLIYAFVFRGVLSITGSSYRIYLNQAIELGTIPVWVFGYLYSASRLLGAIASKFQFKFNLKFGVRSILIINALIFICFIGTGLLYIYNPTTMICMIFIIILCCLSTALRMPHQIFVNNYMQVCVPKKNIERAYALRTMVEYLGYGLISALYAGLLSIYNNNWGKTNLVYIGILAIPLIVSMIFFIKALVKKYAQKFTVVKDEYTKD